MSRKIYWWVVVICIFCLLLKCVLWLAHKDLSGHTGGGASNDIERIAKDWSQTQGKLTVLRIFGTTTHWAKDESWWGNDARVAYVHDGSADIVVDLTKAKVQLVKESGTTNLLVSLPDPELDFSTVGIDPGKMHRVLSVTSSRFRSDEVKDNLDRICRQKNEEKQKDLFSSIDMGAAKVQASKVLLNLYKQVLEGMVKVEVKFQETERSDSHHGDLATAETDVKEGAVQ